MKELWDRTYATNEFVYGKEPNQFFKDTIDTFNMGGQILLPAEGEGRNAVHAAKKGLSVFAFDISAEAKNKALKFAQSENVQIEYEVGEIPDLNLKPSFFDVSALIFAHFPAPVRSRFHREIAKTIKTNGIVILEGFSKGNIQNKLSNDSKGGPDKEEMLFSLKEIESDFQEFDILKLEEIDIELNEGNMHRGLARVVRFIGKKK